MRLKQLTWMHRPRSSSCSVGFGATLNSYEDYGNVYYWDVLECAHGMVAGGECGSLAEGIVLAEAAYLKLLLDQLEPDDEPAIQPDTQDRGQDTAGDGCGGPGWQATAASDGFFPGDQ